MGQPSRVIIATLLGASLCAQQPSIHASRVIAHDTHSNAGGGIFAPENALGPPQGGGFFIGSIDVHSLGTGGFLTLGFETEIIDGPGADFLIAENPFFASQFTSFAEACYVEVSSDGVNFARFASAYHGPPFDPGPFGVLGLGDLGMLAGSIPVRAGMPGIDLQDPVEAGGDAFDLADLRQDPLVIAGLVDLQAISEVRLVDVRGGIDRDSRGRIIHDPSAGSADIDAVTLIHHADNRSSDGPRVELRIPTDGAFELALEDADGLLDLDLGSLRAALFGQPFDPLLLLSASAITEITPTRVAFKFLFTLPPGINYQLAFSIKDKNGQRSGMSRVREGQE